MLAPFHYAFVQRGVVEALLLSIPAGLAGSWLVLRGLAFFSHAVGTAAFPGLVVAAGLGWPAPAGAALAATAYTFGVEGLASRRESDREALTGLTLVGALALGVILASDVFHSGANVETLLFGSLLLVGAHDVRPAASVALAAAEGVPGLWLSVELNVPPGAAIAVLAGGVFVAAALGRLGRPFLAVLAVLLLAGCGSSADHRGRLTVVATTTQIGDWVR